MTRRRFEHLHVEVCLAADRALSRYALWVRLRELGADPERLTRDAALHFCDTQLVPFLAECGCHPGPRARRRLRRRVARYDPRFPTPYEHFARL